MLDHYLEKSYARLKSGRDDLQRTAIGPDLLGSLGVKDNHIIRGVNILNFRAIKRIFDDPKHDIPDYISKNTSEKMGAANLCLNERQFFTGSARQQYDSIIDFVAHAISKRDAV